MSAGNAAADLDRVRKAAEFIRAQGLVGFSKVARHLGISPHSYGFLTTLTDHEPRVYQTDGGLLGYDEGEP